MKTTTYQYTDDGRRYSGVLVHPTCFPSPYGIGDLGQGAYDFIDFLEAAGQTLWQVLPLGPTGFGDSPYQSFSVHAGNPYFIDLEALEKEGYLKRRRAAEWLVCRFGTPPGRAVGRRGVFERMAFSLGSAAGPGNGSLAC